MFIFIFMPAIAVAACVLLQHATAWAGAPWMGLT